MNWAFPHPKESDILLRGLAQELIWQDQVSTPGHPRLQTTQSFPVKAMAAHKQGGC